MHHHKDRSLFPISGMLRRNKASKKGKFKIRNGGLLLEKMISECDGKSNPYSIYSAKELEKATNKYDPNQLIHSDPYFDLYKGFHEEYDCPILVKFFRDYGLEKAIKEIVLSSQANRHKNVLRLLGCCLETEIPILVFEYPHCGTLSKHIGTCNLVPDHPLLPWKPRSKVAEGIAYAIAYLHTGFSKPIIHNNLSSTSIFLDNDFVAKLADFSFSKSIPLGQDHVVGRIVDRTLGHAALEFTIPHRITEKVDVFGFGIVLLEILLGESRSETFLKVDQLLDQSHQAPTASGMASSLLKVNEEINNAHQHHTASSSDSGDIENEGPYSEQAYDEAFRAYFRTKMLPGAESEQFMACGELALKCRRENPEERPTMTEVARELRRIIRSQSPTSNEK